MKSIHQLLILGTVMTSSLIMSDRAFGAVSNITITPGYLMDVEHAEIRFESFPIRSEGCISNGVGCDQNLGTATRLFDRVGNLKKGQRVQLAVGTKTLLTPGPNGGAFSNATIGIRFRGDDVFEELLLAKSRQEFDFVRSDFFHHILSFEIPVVADRIEVYFYNDAPVPLPRSQEQVLQRFYISHFGRNFKINLQ